MADHEDNAALRRRWVTCFLSCLFDLDAGQTVECSYPHGLLTDAESKGIAYGAFPESLTQSGAVRNGVSDSNYAFRIKREMSPCIQNRDSVAYLYCYVYARVRQDERMPRGAEQRSVVLVSEHPYTSILLPVSCTVGPALLQSFRDTAEKVYQDALHTWPTATPGCLTSVSIGPHRMVGRVPLDACLPDSETQLWQPVDGPNMPNPAWAAQCGAFGEVCIARTLEAHNKQLWSLWEVMLLGQPLMVFCSSPEGASCAVLALLALITPLPYEPDYRPLLSIHDPQVQAVQDGERHSKSCPVPTVFGVTNPYFLRSCGKSPNVMTITHAPSALLLQGTLPRSGAEGSFGERHSGAARAMQKMQSRRSSYADISEVLSGQADGMSLQRGLVCTGQDKQVLAKLRAAADAGTSVLWDAASNTLRNHFFNLTVAFMMPFFDFWGVPCPWVSNHQVQCTGDMDGNFQMGAFLTFLSSYKLSDSLLSIVGGKRKALTLYRSFIDGPNFVPWMNSVLKGE